MNLTFSTISNFVQSILVLSSFIALHPALGAGNFITALGGYRANVLIQQASLNKSFFEHISYGGRFERQIRSSHRVYLQYLYSGQEAVALDSFAPDFVDHDLSLGYKHLFAGGRFFLLLGANYIRSSSLDPANAFGGSAGGGLELRLLNRLLVGFTTQYIVVPTGNLQRRSFNQSVDLSFEL